MADKLPAPQLRIHIALPLLQDAARTALEIGNSPAKLFSNYRELADEHDATAWFAIAPKRANNVVAMIG